MAITINTLEINSAADTITVDVATEMGNLFTQLLVWDCDTYNVTANAVDLTSLLAGVDETESFTISSSTDLNIDKFSGVYYLEFTTDESAPNTKVGVVANLLAFHECLLNELLSSSVSGCDVVGTTSCACSDDLIYINTALQSLYDSLLLEYFDESAKICKALNKLCQVCSSCPGYEDAVLVSGLGIKMASDVVILQ